MTFVSKLAIGGMFFSIISFFFWKESLPVPIMYWWGQFLDNWWFLGRGSGVWRDKLPHVNWALDGLPYVAATPMPVYGIASVVGFPYPASYGFNYGVAPKYNGSTEPYYAQSPSNISLTNIKATDVTTKELERYTPIKGMYGVSIYETKALYPNDYIAKRVLGSKHVAQDLVLESLNQAGQLNSGVDAVYNKKTFPGNITPFISQLEGPQVPNDPNWKYVNLYEVPTAQSPNMPFMAPLVSSNGTISPTVYTPSWGNDPNGLSKYYTTQVGYSGAEYPYTNGSSGTLEYQSVQGYRPPWYLKDFLGEPTTGTKIISAYPGSTAGITDDGGFILTPDAYSKFDQSYTVDHYYKQYGWANNNPSQYSNQIVRSMKTTNEFLPTEVSAGYVDAMLLNQATINSSLPPVDQSSAWYEGTETSSDPSHTRPERSPPPPSSTPPTKTPPPNLPNNPLIGGPGQPGGGVVTGDGPSL